MAEEGETIDTDIELEDYDMSVASSDDDTTAWLLEVDRFDDWCGEHSVGIPLMEYLRFLNFAYPMWQGGLMAKALISLDG